MPGWAPDLLVADLERLGEETELLGCLVGPSWGCTCSRGAATCATPSSAPALDNSDVSPPRSFASTVQRAPEARTVG